MFSLICVWINGWINNRQAGDLRRYPAHYDVTLMGPTWGPSGADRTQMGPILAPWILLSGTSPWIIKSRDYGYGMTVQMKITPPMSSCSTVFILNLIDINPAIVVITIWPVCLFGDVHKSVDGWSRRVDRWPSTAAPSVHVSQVSNLRSNPLRARKLWKRGKGSV